MTKKNNLSNSFLIFKSNKIESSYLDEWGGVALREGGDAAVHHDLLGLDLVSNITLKKKQKVLFET